MVGCSHAESPRARSEPESVAIDSDRMRTEGGEQSDRAPGEPAPEDLAPVVEPLTLAEGRALAIPGPDGFLATWGVWASGARGSEEELGRCVDEPGAAASAEPTGREVSPPAALEDRTSPCAPPRVVAFGDWRMELSEAASRGQDVVYLGATLLVPRSTRAFLMVGMRGASAVRLDGREIASATSEDRFRRDLVLAPLALSEGEHRLVIRFQKPERGRWRGAIRWLDARTRPGAGPVGIAVGTPSEEESATLASQAVLFDEQHILSADGPAVRIRAHLPGGGLRREVTVAIDATTATFAPSEANGGYRHEGRSVATVPMPERGGLTLRAVAGDRTERMGEAIVEDRRALDALAALRAVIDAAPDAAKAPIAWRAAELERAVREHDRDARWRQTLERDARRIVRDLERDRDPFGRVRGYERMAFFSRIDGTAQEYELFVPPGYRDGRAWPLLVTLHGFKGNAGDFFRNTFGLARDHENGETLEGHGRHGLAPTSGPMIVIAPTGRGQSFYRHAGEVDVLEAMADVERRFSVDPDRVYVTGGSMGGTGAAYLPYRNPDLFAASAALAGYHDQRVREDTHHEDLSEAERFLEAERSDVDWAENGLHLPTLLVRGTQDRPLEWTRCLARRLETLGYRCEHREPDLGHNVWTETYADGAIFRYLGRYRRPTSPAHVHLRTGRERTDRAFWVRVDQRDAPDRFADIDARIADGVITATIEGARAITFSPEAPLVRADGSITVRVGESQIVGHPPLTIERVPGAGETEWRAATQRWPEEGARHGDVGGPIRDVFHEPLTFVIGTQDPDHTLVNRLVAQHWAHPKGWIVDYPIVDDVDVTDAMIRDRVLVLVGPPSSNLVHARIADRLPIRVAADGVHVGAEVHAGEQVGVAFVAPNPLNPDRAVLVLAGPHPLGTWRSIALPDILPDYVVFDERVAPARDQWACGGTGCVYRAQGFFDMHWRLRAE